MTSPRTTLNQPIPQSTVENAVPRVLVRAGTVVGMVLALAPIGIGAAGAATHAGTTSNAHETEHSNLSVFCTALKPSKLSTAVGGTVKLTQTLVRQGILTCIFHAPEGFMSVEYETGLSTSTYARLSTAKPAIVKLFGSGVKATVKADTAFGGHAYYWTAKISGAPYSGLNYYKGGGGWFIEMPGKLQLTKLENVERIADRA